MKSLWNQVQGLFTAQGDEPAPASDARPLVPLSAAIRVRVALIIHAPRQAGQVPLYRHLGWHDPDALAEQYMADLWDASGGMARYEVVERAEVDGFPPKQDGFVYDSATYLRCLQQGQGWHEPDRVDYHRLLDTFDLVRKVDANQIDEVWLMAFPYAGYYESVMVGPGACWCNAPPLADVRSTRRFVIMGFNYERDVGCMLENFGHRVESLMDEVYRSHPAERNLWQRFTRYDKVAPGQAACGTMHFAPNSRRDYDWGNQRPVRCHADAWYSFPDLSAAPRTMRCDEWGGGDMRAHHMWWLRHLPRVAGETDGVSHNWWPYVLRV